MLLLLSKMSARQIAFAASAVTILQFTPQIWTNYKQGTDAPKMSSTTLTLASMSALLWLVYGEKINDDVIVRSNMLELLLLTVLWCQKWKYNL